MAKNREWTEYEDSRLLEMAERDEQVKIMSERLGRTPPSIRHRYLRLTGEPLRRKHKDVWTQEEEERLKELHIEGQTYSQMAMELRKTRNSVIGKSVRMCLGGNRKKGDARIPNRDVVYISPHSLKYKFRHSSKYMDKEIRNKYDSAQIKGRLSINELDEKSCRYVCSNDKFCGKPIHKKRYCKEHYDACTVLIINGEISKKYYK